MRKPTKSQAGEGALLALEYYDGCLEVVDLALSPSASASAAGEQVQASSSANESANAIPADNSPSSEGFDELLAGENGDTPEDIPEDSTDDLTAAQMKAARAEKNVKSIGTYTGI